MVNVIWHGHACFSIEGSINVLIDPFIGKNPVAKIKPESLNPDIILITHGHFDHTGDAIAISKNSKAPVLASFELSEILKNEVETMDINPGGTIDFKGIKITAVNAVHSSSYNGLYAGASMGYIIDMDGIKIYHAGDTAYFKDMELIGNISKPDTSLLPIGGHYTMDIDGSIKALKMLKSKTVIPMHYNTFPAIGANPEEFKNKVEKAGFKPLIPEVEEVINL